MSVDDAECCRLAAQIVQDAAKHCMLEHIGKIAGMEFVVIVHDRFCQLRVTTRCRPTRRAYAITLARQRMMSDSFICRALPA
jgi:hypothetical protein